jgi:hypothetical protein
MQMEIPHRYGSRVQHLGSGSYLIVTNNNLQTVTSNLRHASASTSRESLLLARRRDYQVDAYVYFSFGGISLNLSAALRCHFFTIKKK